MLDEAERKTNYAYQRVAIGGFVDYAEWMPTPRQRRRIKHKANRHLGDKLRSSRQRKLMKLQESLITPGKAKMVLQKLQERRATPDPQPSTAPGDESVREEQGKSLCLTCEPKAPDWACRTKSGKKTKDHAGRVR